MCHQIGGAGLEVGPPLDGWGKTQTREVIVRSIVDLGMLRIALAHHRQGDAAGLQALFAGCAGNSKQMQAGNYLLEDHHEGRIYVFYDKKTYQSFKQVGETAYRLTRIGAGPKGETVVFGLTKQDKKKRSGIAAISALPERKR